MTQKVLTFIDAGVLIAAVRGVDSVAAQAMAFLDDPARQFVRTDFLRLEVMPKAVFHGHVEEAGFYEEFFAQSAIAVVASANLTERAYLLACRYGLSAVDSLHVAAAVEAGATELVTTERRASPLFRIKEIRVTTIHPGSAPD